ncbi:pentapeptide repeat-containing protein [Nocardiopsis quinghaiensis]|uniref:pentapeptide repeat-containing protein n=1 Tax=Nocardiopsis quinghaiensis TaxID=464995 RepID=UPI0016814827|nr:pentapeptide repeat-containing protein [Nocardiopsis quinghaiensis]
MALWPLATTIWDLLGFTEGQTWRVVAVGVCALLLAAGVVGVNWKRTTPVRLVWLILTAWALAAGAVAAMTALAWLVLDTPQWKPPGELTPKDLDAIATRAFAIVAGLGGVALLVIAYRRQRTTEAGEEREVSKLFTDTFDSASDKLGSEHAAVRLAGVHALARLADEAPEGREDLVQMVIDVLCAYLRMPYTPAPDDLPKNASKARREEHREHELEFASFREVRHTIIRIIGNHLREPTRWRGKDYDFTGVVFDGGNLTGAHFTGGRVDFTEARFTDGKVFFVKARFTGAEVFFVKTRFVGGKVGGVFFRGAEFSKAKVFFSEAMFSGGEVSFEEAEFSAAQVSFFKTVFSGGEVNFQGTKFLGARMAFPGAEFSGAQVSFSEADFRHPDFSDKVELPHTWVSFGGAKFSDGTVSFDKAAGMCPEGLLIAMTHGEPGVVCLPEQWQPVADRSGKQEGPGPSADAPGH